MARKRGPLLVTLSLIFGLGAAWLANNWMTARANSRPASLEVVTAALDIPLGTQIEERHLSTIQMLPGTEPRGAYKKKSALLGKIAKAPIIAGEIILEPRVADLGSGSPLAAVVAKDMRAITVRVDDVVGVGGFLLPGNRVDVLATRKETNQEPVTETILDNVKVLAVDQTAASDSNQPVVVRAVTLEVSPADAEILTKGKAAGTIQLTLRNPLDDKLHVKPKAPEKVTRVVVARPKAAPAPSITVIRGTLVDKDRSAVTR
jgi:pilus assembly protein CpaB